MPTHPRTHSDDTLIAAEILEEAAKPRQAASVKKALKKKRPVLVAPETLGGKNGGKAKSG